MTTLSVAQRLQRAIDVIAAEPELHRGTFIADGKNPRTCPACAIGALTRALPREHYPFIASELDRGYVSWHPRELEEYYGTPNLGRLLNVNDDADNDDRKALVIAYLKDLQSLLTAKEAE